MRDSGSDHKKVQEMCDCYATSDPLKEMSNLAGETDRQAAAVKWLALAALHGINHNAETISITRDEEGRTRVVAEYRIAELPSPGKAVGEAIFDTVRSMTHIEADKGKTALALGIRDSSVELKVKVKRKNGGETVSLDFPKA